MIMELKQLEKTVYHDDITISDTFIENVEPTTFYLEVWADNGGNVTAIPSLTYDEFGQSCSGTFAVGTEIELTAVPTESWEFYGWHGENTDGVHDETITITMNSNQDLEAYFSWLYNDFEDGWTVWSTSGGRRNAYN